LVKSREEEEEKEEEESNIGSQGCAAARGRQPKIGEFGLQYSFFHALGI